MSSTHYECDIKNKPYARAARWGGFMTNCAALRVVLVATFSLCLGFAAKQEVPMQMTFDAPVESVYAAEVQAAGSTLKSAVKEACTVNFVSSSTTNFSSAVFHGSLICRDNGDGKTVVTLSLQSGNGGTMFHGPAREKLARIIWSNLEAALKMNSSGSHAHDQSTISPPSEDLAAVTVKSTPDGADITVDGKFSGNAPSTLRLAAGDHIITVAMKGFRNWERTINLTTGGAITINAALEHEH
jgi:PEGA domain-containing protein